ncbi:MAG: hypothetical protein D6B28_11690, partial [Gammaproteobacteria bacterium]
AWAGVPTTIQDAQNQFYYKGNLGNANPNIDVGYINGYVAPNSSAIPDGFKLAYAPGGIASALGGAALVPNTAKNPNNIHDVIPCGFDVPTVIDLAMLDLSEYTDMDGHDPSIAKSFMLSGRRANIKGPDMKYHDGEIRAQFRKAGVDYLTTREILDNLGPDQDIYVFSPGESLETAKAQFMKYSLGGAGRVLSRYDESFLQEVDAAFAAAYSAETMPAYIDVTEFRDKAAELATNVSLRFTMERADLQADFAGYRRNYNENLQYQIKPGGGRFALPADREISVIQRESARFLLDGKGAGLLPRSMHRAMEMTDSFEWQKLGAGIAMVLAPGAIAGMRSRIASMSARISSRMSGSANAGGKTVTLYRVDDAAFPPRITPDGSVPVVTTKAGNERALFVNIGQTKRAKEFASINRGGNAKVTAVEVDASLLEKLRTTAVYDKSAAARLNPSAPLKVDINKAPDQYGLRTREQIQWLRDAIKPGTARTVDPRKL